MAGSYARYSGLSGGGSGAGVSSLNGQTGAISLVAGTNITIVPGAGTLTINSSAGGGSVTSVGLALPSIFTVSGSPVTTSGTLTGSLNTQSPNLVFAGPASGGAAVPTFRSLVAADIPAIDLTTGVTGILPSLNGGTGVANSFNLTIGATSSISGTNTNDITLGTANGLSLVGQALSLGLSSTSTTGALSSTDWNTFNGKQAAGNYITDLTGDVTATGPGSVVATLATVNGNVGTFGSSTSIPTFTVNAKGLITAASGNAVIAPAGTLSGTTLNATVVSSSLTSVGTITSGTWNGTTIAIANGGTGQTTASAAFGALSPLTTKGDILTYSTVNDRLPVGTNGFVLTADSTQTLGIKWAAAGGGSTARVNALYDEVVGSAGQVASGAATQTSINAAIAAVGTDGTILVLRGTYTENVVIDKRLAMWGQGFGSIIDGTLTFDTGSDDTMVTAMNVNDNIILTAGVHEIQMYPSWQANGKTVIGDQTNNDIHGMRL